MQAVSKKLQPISNETSTQPKAHDDANVSAVDVQRLPLDGFGSLIKEYIEDVAEVYGRSTDPVAASCLSVLGSVCANKVSAVLRGEDGNVIYNVIPNVFTCYVADASSGKSQAITTPAKPLEEIDKELFNKYTQELKYNAENKLPDPRLRQIVIGNTTPQAVVSALRDNCDELNNMVCGGLMLDDEMNGFFKQAADAKGTDFISLLCKAFDGGSYKVNRVTSGRVIFNNFMLSFAGGIQTKSLKKYLTDDLLATGFLQRFIWTFDDGQKRKPSRRGMKATPTQYWAQVLADINHMANKQFELTPDATALYWRWLDNCFDYKNDTDDGLLAQFIDKHSYFVLRLALLFAVLHKQDAIEYDDVKNAIDICNYCLHTDVVLLGFAQFGVNVSDLNQDTILHNLLQRCVAKGAKVNLKELSRVLGQNPNWASVKENQYKRRHGVKVKATKEPDTQQEPQPEPTTATGRDMQPQTKVATVTTPRPPIGAITDDHPNGERLPQPNDKPTNTTTDAKAERRTPNDPKPRNDERGLNSD